MLLLPIIAVLAVILLTAMLVVLVVRGVRRAASRSAARPPAEPLTEPPTGLLTELPAGRAGGLGWRWLGVVVGAVVAVQSARTGGLGRGILLAAPLFGLCAMTGVLIGELTVAAPRGPTRQADLRVRRVADYLPRRLTSVVAGAAGALATLAAVTTVAGGPDDLGRAGRMLIRQCSPEVSEAHGAWPGSFYTAPLAAIVLVGAVFAAISLSRIARRPRPSVDPAATTVDDRARARAAEAVVAAAGVVVALPLAGLALTAAGGLWGISCAPGWWTWASWLLLAVVVLATLLIAACLALLLLPRPLGEAARASTVGGRA